MVADAGKLAPLTVAIVNPVVVIEVIFTFSVVVQPAPSVRAGVAPP
jgi:hypothetical protein